MENWNTCLKHKDEEYINQKKIKTNQNDKKIWFEEICFKILCVKSAVDSNHWN